MKSTRFLALSIILLFVIISACEKILPKAPESEDVLAVPIDGLTNGQLALHLEGGQQFSHIFSAREGLGPIFIQASCENCHVGDGKGNPFNNLTRFGRYVSDTDTVIWDPMILQGGPQLQHRSITNYPAEQLPANVSSTRFVAPNVTGMGYLEAVEDQYILDIAAQQSVAGIVSGQVNWVDPPSYFKPVPSHVSNGNGQYIGRFGRKGIAINLLQQAVGAYRNNMGITSDFDLNDPINYSVSGLGADNVPDPEVSTGAVNAVVFYLQTLEAPRRRNIDDPDVVEGESIFKNLGCNNCHKETMLTGPSQVNALNNVTFNPYTDMLFHNMGGALDDGYREGSLETNEWRTTPLWGLGLQTDSQGGRVFLLHDGRATSYDEAIQYHGGEAGFSRDAFNQLSNEDKLKLAKFLNSL